MIVTPQPYAGNITEHSLSESYNIHDLFNSHSFGTSENYLQSLVCSETSNAQTVRMRKGHLSDVLKNAKGEIFTPPFKVKLVNVPRSPIYVSQ